MDHVPLFGGRGVIRPRPPHPSTRKWSLGEGFWGEGGERGDGGELIEGPRGPRASSWGEGQRGRGVIRLLPPTLLTRKWTLGEALWGGEGAH